MRSAGMLACIWRGDARPHRSTRAEPSVLSPNSCAENAATGRDAQLSTSAAAISSVCIRAAAMRPQSSSTYRTYGGRIKSCTSYFTTVISLQYTSRNGPRIFCNWSTNFEHGLRRPEVRRPHTTQYSACPARPVPLRACLSQPGRKARSRRSRRR